MDIVPVQLIIFSLPPLVYAFVAERRGHSSIKILDDLGLRFSLPVYYSWALAVALAVGVPGLLFAVTISEEAAHDPNVRLSQYEGLTLGVGTFLIVLLREAIYVALGEETFFGVCLAAGCSRG